SCGLLRCLDVRIATAPLPALSRRHEILRCALTMTRGRAGVRGFGQARTAHLLRDRFDIFFDVFFVIFRAALRTLRFVLDAAATRPFPTFRTLLLAAVFLPTGLPSRATLRWTAPTTWRAAFTEAISA